MIILNSYNKRVNCLTMNKQDQRIIIIVIILILIKSCVLVIGSYFGKLSYVTCIFNMAAGITILVYWIQKQLRISQHIFEGREITLLALETAMAGLAVYSFIVNQYNGWLMGIQYLFFGIHFLALLVFLAYMLLFRMKKLI